MSLRWKLLLIIVPTTLVISSAVGVLLVRHGAFHDLVVTQQANRSLAANLVKENILYTGGQLDPVALDNVFHTLVVVNPAISVYLLKSDGSVYMHGATEAALVAPKVDLRPIRRFLDGSGEFPLRGTDPLDPHETAVFSVAPVDVDGKRFGYLYVVLVEPASGAGARWSQVILVVLFGILLLGGVLATTVLRLVSRRIERLDRAVGFFRNDLGHSEAAAPMTLTAAPEGRGDEIDSVTRQTVEMSRTIVQQLDGLAATDRLRRQLVANVSHDLRTPLTAVEGYLQTVLVKGAELDGKTRRQYVETAYRSARRLRELIVELFELSRLESENRALAAEEFCIAELISDVVQKLELIADRRGVRLVLDVDSDAAYAVGELGLIERVLDNLIVNAIKHSPRGSVVAIRLREGTPGHVRVSVIDEGTGIAEEDLPYVFNRFYRPSTSGAQQTPGAGLGLAIVRRIMELHASRVEACSRLGQGSTFSFWLPTAEVAG